MNSGHFAVVRAAPTLDLGVMKLRVVLVGRDRGDPIVEASEVYVERLARSFPTHVVEVREEPARAHAPPDRVRAEEAKRILELVSPITHLTAASVPTLVIHGTQDPTVPFSQAEALVKRLSELAVPHRFIPVVKGEHAFPLTPHPRNQKTNLVPEVVQFLRQHL